MGRPAFHLAQPLLFLLRNEKKNGSLTCFSTNSWKSDIMGHFLVLIILAIGRQQMGRQADTSAQLDEGLCYPGKHLKAGHLRPASETPFEWHFACGPMVARHCMLAGIHSLERIKRYLHLQKCQASGRSFGTLKYTPSGPLHFMTADSFIAHI